MVAVGGGKNENLKKSRANSEDGKGGKTTNSAVGDTMIHREMKEAGKN